MTWNDFMQQLRGSYDFRQRKPVSSDLVSKALNGLGLANPDLKEFYRATNGLSFEWFTVFAIEDPNDIKRTWKGLGWANALEKTSYLNRSEELLRRFVVFADIGDSKVGVIDRKDNSIWFEENGKLHQTDLGLREFVELGLKEAAELA